MAKNKIGIGVILALVAGILAAVAAGLYMGVMYKKTLVYFLLIGATVLAIVGLAIATKVPKLSGYIPVAMAFLLAFAAVRGTELMVNQLGYVVAGLDGMDTIMSYIQFVSVTAAAMLVSILASFTKMAKAK